MAGNPRNASAEKLVSRAGPGRAGPGRPNALQIAAAEAARLKELLPSESGASSVRCAGLEMLVFCGAAASCGVPR